MGDKNPKKQKKKKRIETHTNPVNPAALKLEQGVEQVSGKRLMKQSRGR